VIKSEPYLADEYRFKKKHLIEAYAEILGVDYDENTLPDIGTFDHEEDGFKTFQQQVLQNQEYIVMQITGGTSYYTPQTAGQKIIKSRDYPKELGQQFVDLFTAKYPNIKVIQVGLPTEPQLQKVFYMTNLQSRAYFPVIEHCKTFVVIDSFLSHISAGYKKKGVVLWGGTNPANLGYAHNVNLSDSSLCGTLFCNRPNTFLFDTQAGALWQCNKKYNCMRIPPATILDEVSKIIDAGPAPVNGKCTNCVVPETK
jgi:ADP-heptose:LPS heptosyltransferase